MKTVFQLEEGKTYNVNQNGYTLHRKFRVVDGVLENNGLGHFAPCDWVPLNAGTKFIETSAPLSAKKTLFSRLMGALGLKSKKLTLVQLKEGVVYSSSSIKENVVVKEGQLCSFESGMPLSMKKISLKARFKEVKILSQNDQEKELQKIPQVIPYP